MERPPSYKEDTIGTIEGCQVFIAHWHSSDDVVDIERMVNLKERNMKLYSTNRFDADYIGRTDGKYTHVAVFFGPLSGTSEEERIRASIEEKTRERNHHYFANKSLP